jgi:hypothetical protein
MRFAWPLLAGITVTTTVFVLKGPLDLNVSPSSQTETEKQAKKEKANHEELILVSTSTRNSTVRVRVNGAQNERPLRSRSNDVPSPLSVSETKHENPRLPDATKAVKPSDVSITTSSSGGVKVPSNATFSVLSANEKGTDHDRGRPQLVLHIGPHKTATSTIQCDFTFHSEYLDRTAAFVYIGRRYAECRPQGRSSKYQVDTRQLISCLDRHDVIKRPCDKRTEWQQLETLLTSLAKKKKNVVISDEAFSRMKTSTENMKLLEETLSKHFSVQVVVVYRRYYEWLLSMYNEKYKPLFRRRRYQQWPDNHGVEIRPFVDYYRRALHNQGFGGYQLKAEKANFHPAEWLRQLWQPFFSNTIVFNMHDEEGRLMTNFIKKVFPSTVDASKYMQQHQAPAMTNPSLNLNHDMLAVAAYQKGLVRRKLKRRQVAFAVEGLYKQFQSKHNSTITVPMVCLTQSEQESLLNRSLALERTVFGVDGNKKQHELEFAEARHHFCNVDTKKVVANKAWQKFFSSL